MDIVKSFADYNNLKIINVSHLDYLSLSKILMNIRKKPNILLVLEHNKTNKYITDCFNDIDSSKCEDIIRIFYKYDYIYFNIKIINNINKLNRWFNNITNDIKKVSCDICYNDCNYLYNCPTCFSGYCKCCILKSFKRLKCKKCSFCQEPFNILIYCNNRKVV